MKNQYVLLTGSKNNAGDFLIKYRMTELLNKFRPDRELIYFDSWMPFSSEQLKTINESRALILAGGPTIRPRMYPEVYPMVKNLNDIKVPIIMMALGWKSVDGSWQSTYKDSFSEETLELIKKISSSGYLSSVRDYHSLNLLFHKGFNNFIMTGCAALYSLEHLNQEFIYPKAINNVSLSIGQTFINNEEIEITSKEIILWLKKRFSENFVVVFHHSLDKGEFSRHHKTIRENHIFSRHLEMVSWLKENNIRYTDIGGNEQNLINHYKTCDLHIGYRVHAHIFMNSISRPSILISEDGRAKALRDVIGGLILDGYAVNSSKNNLLAKILRKLKLTRPPLTIIANPYLTKDLILNLEYEINNHYPRIAQTRRSIDYCFGEMKRFIQQLP